MDQSAPDYSSVQQIRIHRAAFQIAEGTPREQALKNVGYSDSVARAPSPQLRRKLRTHMQMALTKAGMTDQRLAALMIENVGATKPVVIARNITDYPDYATRVKAVEQILKVKGDLAPESQQEIRVDISIEERRAMQDKVGQRIAQWYVPAEIDEVPAEVQADGQQPAG